MTRFMRRALRIPLTALLVTGLVCAFVTSYKGYISFGPLWWISVWAVMVAVGLYAALEEL